MTGSLKHNFAKYVSFNILASMGTSAYVLADTFFVANGVGTDGLTALNLAIAVFSLMIAIGLMLGIGGATVFAINRARGEMEAGSRAYTISLKTGLVIGLFLMVLGIFFSKGISLMLGANEQTLEMTDTYVKTIMCFAPVYIMNNMLVPFVRNDGRPKLAAIAVLIGNLTNIILDYVFVYPLQMGIFGAALATCVAPIITIGILSEHFVHRKNTFHFIKGKITGTMGILKKIASLGVFAFVNEMANGIVIFVFNWLLLGLGGNIAVAAYGVIANISLVAVATFTGISQGSQPLISQAYGAGDEKSMSKVYKWGAVLALGIATLLMAVVMLFDVEIANLFNKDGNSQLTLIASSGLKIYFAGFFFAGLNIITAGYMSAMEQGIRGFIISISRGLVAIIPAAIIMSMIWGITGVWLAFSVAEIITLIISVASQRSLRRSA